MCKTWVKRMLNMCSTCACGYFSCILVNTDTFWPVSGDRAGGGDTLRDTV